MFKFRVLSHQSISPFVDLRLTTNFYTMSKPIIYLTFANQKDEHLALLKEESSQIQHLLLPIEAREFISVKREESAASSDIINLLATFPNQVAIFHYGGHANSTQLQLEDQSAQSKGLAKLLGEQKKLQLVFLNGCSTKAQVDLLFEAGVKAVIATAVKIKDRIAVQFAQAFYQALVNKRTIKRAFEFAKSSVEMTFAHTPDIDIHRDLAEAGASPATVAEEAMPWGLYVQEKFAPEVLNWRLPYYRELGLPKEMITYIGQKFQLNRYIVMVLDEMCRYNKDIYSQMVEVVNGEEVKKDSSTYLDLVIKNFPWVIGSQIQLLRQKNKPDAERFQQLLSTYIISSQVLYFILLSNFWDEHRRLGFKLPKDFLNQLRITEDKLLNFDFLAMMLQLFQVLKQNDADLFIPEYEIFCDTLQRDSHLAKAKKYLDKLQNDFPNLPPGDLDKQCITTEQALAIILQKAAFLADYRMLTIRDIYIDNPRFSPETYQLNLGALNAIVNTSLSLYEDENKRRKLSYSNCKSIVLVNNEKDLKQSLNLSPFIIDKNTFLHNEHIDLFIYGYEKEGIHYYLAVKHSIFIAHHNQKGTDIIDTSMTLEDFKEGRNIRQNQEEEEDFGFGAAFGSPEQDTLVKESPTIFALLGAQFEQFYSDLSE